MDTLGNIAISFFFFVLGASVSFFLDRRNRERSVDDQEDMRRHQRQQFAQFREMIDLIVSEFRQSVPKLKFKVQRLSTARMGSERSGEPILAESSKRHGAGYGR